MRFGGEREHSYSSAPLSFSDFLNPVLPACGHINSKLRDSGDCPDSAWLVQPVLVGASQSRFTFSLSYLFQDSQNPGGYSAQPLSLTEEEPGSLNRPVRMAGSHSTKSFYTKPEEQQMHVEGVTVEGEKVCVTSLLPTFPLTPVPVKNDMVRGQSFSKWSTAHSGVKKSFHLSQGSDERHELREVSCGGCGSGAWVAGPGVGRRGSRV